jgi:cell division protease FtsH
MRKMSGGGGGGSGQISILAKAKLLMKNRCKTTFKDVAGLEGAKKKYKKLSILEKPEKYTNLGGKIPKELYL